MITLDPLRAIITELERVVEDVASKVENAVVSDVSQTAVDELVGRVGGAVEKLAGITPAPAPAPGTTQPQPIGVRAPVWTPPMSAGAPEPAAPAPAAPAAETAPAAAPAWTPEHPAA